MPARLFFKGASPFDTDDNPKQIEILDQDIDISDMIARELHWATFAIFAWFQEKGPFCKSGYT